MNINFSTHSLFSWYVVLLLLSGVVMLVLTAVRVGQKPAGRILNLLFGVGFLGYGIYLGFIFNGGTYVVFFQVFILPVLLVVSSLRSAARRRASAIPQVSAQNISANPGQPGR
jgi:hypothetical protein